MFPTLSAHLQELPCQLEDVAEGALCLSKAIMANGDYRPQHPQVLEHFLDLVQKLSQQRGDRGRAPMLNRITHLLQCRQVKLLSHTRSLHHDTNLRVFQTLCMQSHGAGRGSLVLADLGEDFQPL